MNKKLGIIALLFLLLSVFPMNLLLRYTAALNSISDIAACFFVVWLVFITTTALLLYRHSSSTSDPNV